MHISCPCIMPPKLLLQQAPLPKFPFPRGGLRLAGDQIHFPVSLSRSGPAFNKDEGPGTDRARRAPPGSAHARARARPFALQPAVPALGRKPEEPARSQDARRALTP